MFHKSVENVAVSRFSKRWGEDLQCRYTIHRGSLQQLHYSVHTRRVITFISIMTGEQLNLHGKSHRSVTKFARGSVIVLPLRPTCNKASPSVPVYTDAPTHVSAVGWGVYLEKHLLK